MDDRKPAIPPDEFRLEPASERASTDVDSFLAEATNSNVAVYYRNETEVGEGFLIALRAMGLAPIEQFPEPAKPFVREAKPR